ncbi:MAG: VWA domain-containing protein [Clostridia bacterium]|nr:VWA domain-containing protein [Clostridia bacterium]
MSLLAPLGLIALSSILALIIIYIIRPNYQQKFISTTFVWKLSLKYRKKKIPTSKLRNIILIICQILILTVCSFVLAHPAKIKKEQVDYEEVIVVLDSSASMRALNDEYKTRYERAIELIKDRTENVFEGGGLVSLIVADADPDYLFERYDKTNEYELGLLLDEMLEEDSACTYGSADIQTALNKCEDILSDNPRAKIVLYTDTDYDNAPKGVEIVHVYDRDSEWNVAILNAGAELDENYYNFVVEVASYGRAYRATVDLRVENGNADDASSAGITYNYSTDVYCPDGVPQTVIFRHSFSTVKKEDYEDENIAFVEQSDFYSDMIYSYQRVHVSIAESDDSIDVDNRFDIYGGQKEVIKVQYSSSNPNPFTRSVLLNLRSYYNSIGRWDMQLTEVKRDTEPSTEGFDFYVFEDKMPERLPTDGVVFLIDPSSTPNNLGVRIDSNPYAYRMGDEFVLVPLIEGDDTEHPVMSGVSAYDIQISAYRRISGYDSGQYSVLMSCSTGEPAFLIKDSENSKVVIMAFSVHYSNIGLLPAYPRLMLNVMNYFFPPTIEKNAFEVGDTVSVNSRGDSVDVIGTIEKIPTLTEFPAKVKFNIPGTYTFLQTTYFGKNLTDSAFVNIPSYESNITVVEDGLITPYVETDPDEFFKDLLLYFAIGLVSLLFIERLLHFTET